MKTSNGESVSDHELKKLTRQFQKLTPSAIDKLLRAVNFKIFKDSSTTEPGEFPFRAATRKFIDSVQNDFRRAGLILKSIIFEVGAERVREELARMGRNSEGVH
jgi:hypothetical protein